MVRDARASEYEAQPQSIIAIGNSYAAGHLHPSHRHRRAQLLYSATGVMIVATEHGTWVVPPLRAVWIPGGVTHEIRMVGAVATRSIYIEPNATANVPDRCRVVGISRLLHTLLVEAVDLPVAYESDARAGHIMALILHEITSLAELPLCVPFPADGRLAKRCRQFLEAPSANDTIDSWATALHMSRRAFTRMFRHQTGLSFAAWRQQACLVAALPRLLAGESVTSVAIGLNYGSPSTFTTMFKRILGAAPAAISRQAFEG